MSADDRRKNTRIELVLKIEYDNPGDFLADYAVCASEGGMFIATTRPFAVGEQLSFDISFPGLLSPIHCLGEIRWRRPVEQETAEKPAGIGVSFVFRSKEEADKIQTLIKQLTQTTQLPAMDPKTVKPFRVLVVEDNPLVREMLRFAVRTFHNTNLAKQAKLEIVEAENGGTAWDQIQVESVDLAITDYYMPVMSGVDLIRKIRTDHKHRALPIIVISVGGEEARRESYSAGADLFLDKPVLMRQLLESLHRLVVMKHRQTG
jgi:uncharacterized protein (TIGR02266 family)